MTEKEAVFSLDSKWYNGEPDYMPYCLNCSTMWRLSRTPCGAKCKVCGKSFKIAEESLIKFKEVNGKPWFKGDR